MRIELSGVEFHRARRSILRQVCWQVRQGEHWAVVGANGSGKTTLLQVAVGYLWPTEGSVSVLGEQFGQVDLRQLRRKIGWVSSSLAGMIHGEQTALQIVLSGAFAATGLFDKPSKDQKARAGELLEQLGCRRIADSAYRVLSLGEQQRVLIARALMPRPEVLILDEACAGLDLPSREGLLEMIDQLARRDAATLILVTHHIEEIPPAFSHVLVLKNGQVLSAGPKKEVLTGATLSRAFDLSVEVEHHYGRYWPRIAKPGGSGS